MKRAMLWMAATVLTACSPNPPERTGGEVEAAGDWARPPAIERVERTGAALSVSGLSDPEARVVLRGDDGDAFAATADSRGRFEIRIPAPAAGHLMLHTEIRVGQDAVPSPDRLLVLGAGRGPIAVLRPGGPTLRLDAAPALGAIDSDGRMRLASGRVRAGTTVVEVESGDETVQVTPDAEGRWSVILPAREGPDLVRVAGRDFPWPGEGVEPGDLSVERAGPGWRVRWVGSGGAGQTTWLPDRATP